MHTVAQETGLGFAGLALVLGAVGAVILGIKDGVMRRKASAAGGGLRWAPFPRALQA